MSSLLSVLDDDAPRVPAGERVIDLCDLPNGGVATVFAVSDAQPGDTIARRLRDLGFVRGEQIRLVARAAFGGDPLVVQIGFTRFALRRSEAVRVTVQRISAPPG
jgi:ferrous iron transport protein A